METMTLVFMTGKGPLSWVIRKFTKSTTSHVGVGTVLHGLPVLIHADIGGVQVAPRAKFLKRELVVAEFKWLDDPKEELERACKLLGEKYDYVGLFGFALVIAARWIGKRIKNPLASPRAFVCSELVRQIDPNGDVVSEWKELDPEKTQPAELLEICFLSPKFEKL